MKSRKMVTDEFVCNAKIDTDVENKRMDTKEGKWSGMNWEMGLTYTHYYVQNRWLMRTYCIAQGILLNALWWLKCEGNPKKGKYTHTYSWFTLPYSEN